MTHWMRSLPEVDQAFIDQYVVPLEERYEERDRIRDQIKTLETKAHIAATERWPDAIISFQRCLAAAA